MILMFFAATSEAPQLINFPEKIYVHSNGDVEINATFTGGAVAQLISWQLNGKNLPDFYNKTEFRLQATHDMDEANVTIFASGYNGVEWSITATTTVHIYTPRWLIATIVIGSALIIAIVMFILYRKGVCQMPAWLGQTKSMGQYAQAEAGQSFDFGNSSSDTVGITLDDDESL